MNITQRMHRNLWLTRVSVYETQEPNRLKEKNERTRTLFTGCFVFQTVDHVVRDLIPALNLQDSAEKCLETFHSGKPRRG